MGSFPDKLEALIIDVNFTEDFISVTLADAREVSAPLAWFPKLFSATNEEKNDWRLIGNGIGIHWSQIDEDISISGLLREK